MTEIKKYCLGYTDENGNIHKLMVDNIVGKSIYGNGLRITREVLYFDDKDEALRQCLKCNRDKKPSDEYLTVFEETRTYTYKEIEPNNDCLRCMDFERCAFNYATCDGFIPNLDDF